MSFEQFFQLVAAVLFFVLFFGKTTFIAWRGVNPFAFIGSKSRSRVLVEILLLVAFAGFFVEVFNHAFGGRVRLLPEFMHKPLFEGALTDLVAIFFIGVGFLVLTISYIDLGISWRIGMDDDQPFSLVTTGIYRYTRNPIYLALNLYVWGTFLMTPTPVFLILALLVTATAHAVTLSEESYLLERFGAAFENYLKHTNRYVPFRRSSASVAASARPALPTPTPPRHRLRGRGIKETIGNILTRPEERRTAGQVIVWWEQRRGYYNLAVFFFCLIFLVFGLVWGLTGIIVWAVASIILVVTSNIWYMGGWIAELLLRVFIGDALLGFGPWTWGAGVGFSFLFCAYVLLRFLGYLGE